MNLSLPPLHHDTFPFEHGWCDGFLPPSLYREISSSFPRCPANSGPTGYSLFADDPQYAKLMAESPAWARLHALTHSQSFVDYCASEFADVADAHGSSIDLRAARYIEHVETREAKEAPGESHDRAVLPELFVRMDILQGNVGYQRSPHLDHRRRAVTILVYCCDALEAQLQGGSLVLHKDDVFQSESKQILPAHNRAVGFACFNRSLHSVPRITSQRSPRNFLQITVSSRFDVWPARGVAARIKWRIARTVSGCGLAIGR